MSEILILLVHSTYQRSHANRAMAEAASALPGVAVAHLDALYPDGDIDLDAEVARLIAAERIVLQFPINWYAPPPMLGRWQDAVLTRMFYINAESEGAKIAGRPLLVAATAGNRPAAYTPEGINRHPLAELMKPLESTASRCGLVWQEPLLQYEAGHATPDAAATMAKTYVERLEVLRAIR